MYGNLQFYLIRVLSTMCHLPMTFSRFTWIYPIKQKSEVYTVICNFKSLVENLFNCRIQMFQTDGGDETSMHDFFLKRGNYFRKSSPDIQQHNGVSERKRRHLLK